jgi:hypothetical protein
MHASPGARLPYGGPAWLTARHVAFAGLMVPGLAVGAVVLAVDAPWTYSPTTAVVVAALGLAAQAATGRFVARAPTRPLVFVVALGAQVVTAGVCCFALGLGHEASMAESARRLDLLPFIAALEAAACGIPLGVWQGILGSAVYDERRAPSLESRDRLLMGLGSWTAAAGALAACLAALTDVWRAYTLPWGLTTILLPLIIAVAGSVNRRARRRWIASVAGEHEPGWRLVDGLPCAVEDVPPLPRLTHDPRGSDHRVLVRTKRPGAPFRETDVLEPVALVSCDVLRR